MVLLIYHFDKHDTNTEIFDNQPIRLDLGFFPKQNTYIKLRQVGYCVNTRGGNVHLSFPDILTESVTNEEIDESYVWEVKGITLSNNSGENGFPNEGNYDSCSEHTDLNLNLGTMDTQKDFFTVIVNGRRAVDGGTSNNLSGVSIVLEMSHHNRHT